MALDAAPNTPLYADTLAFPINTRSHLYTSSEFGCVMFEPKGL